ncbi:SH3 domain-containing protein [Corallococcus praedator]|uniref:SH3 domain-containing protein n=1 Tax=Corallococcus praedator TaxID=2316724 RepID=A0ABX9QMP5_9BACT|nr:MULTISPECIES: SH3 domain-containing protein [Corallococcus]RKH34252.1 SH3 domain-containing protein [Corallococcus sp. CA031C]RKI12377.1 SH3 domain-containing protein [Corallococcus praedator]
MSDAATQGYYTAEEAEAVFQQANDAYVREDYPSAQASYEKLLAHGFGGPDVLYNLGTTHLARGDLGRAVLTLEQARKQGGRSEDLEANLALARARQVDKVVGATADEAFLPRLAAATDGAAAAWVFLAAWLVGFALLLLRRVFPSARRTAVAVVAALCLTAAVPAGLLLGAHIWVHQNVHEAVVLASTLVARELPRAEARSLFEVHAGLKVQLLEETGKYVRIRLPNGLEGWAERDGIAEI